MDEPSVKFVSKKVGDQEQSYLKISDQEAYQNYFGDLKHMTTPKIKSILEQFWLLSV